MAKKKVGITDWKFILMMLGILLVGLSVFVLNQKVTYQSEAANREAILRSCRFFNYNQCRAQCSQEFANDTEVEGSDQENTSRNYKTAREHRNCLASCSSMRSLCAKAGNTTDNDLNTPPQTQNYTGEDQTDEEQAPPGLASQCYNARVACKNQCNVENESCDSKNYDKFPTQNYAKCIKICDDSNQSPEFIINCKKECKTNFTIKECKESVKNSVSICRRGCDTEYKYCMQNY